MTLCSLTKVFTHAFDISAQLLLVALEPAARHSVGALRGSPVYGQCKAVEKIAEVVHSLASLSSFYYGWFANPWPAASSRACIHCAKSAPTSSCSRPRSTVACMNRIRQDVAAGDGQRGRRQFGGRLLDDAAHVDQIVRDDGARHETIAPGLLARHVLHRQQAGLPFGVLLALVAGRKRVSRPAIGNTALRIGSAMFS